MDGVMKMRKLVVGIVFSLLSTLCFAGQGAINTKLVRITTTTSTTNSGLMKKLKPAFEADTGYQLRVEAYGTGRALRSAREGNSDAIIVHAPSAEMKFMQSGYGLSRLPVMKNEFVIIGPKEDPADIRKASSAINAFKAIAISQSLLVSRGDDSGTHKKELSIWSAVNMEPYGKWYIEYGHGMGKTLSYADEINAYVLVDKGTWLAKRRQLNLVQLYSGDKILDNPYHVISVNPVKLSSINSVGADRFIQWITSKRAQDIIRGFTVDNEPLFVPAQ